ncbi:MAG: hypothetical protein FWD12_08930 [Alphaproteobacteria bacterium]|nr:hypothetical protein [Alphaproteobacteria bacterium]
MEHKPTMVPSSERSTSAVPRSGVNIVNVRMDGDAGRRDQRDGGDRAFAQDTGQKPGDRKDRQIKQLQDAACRLEDAKEEIGAERR